jgi:DNA-binding LacI/PurR family transcriptional regulator
MPVDPNAEHVRRLVEKNIPCVILGTEPVPNADQVNVDVARGAYLAAKLILRQIETQREQGDTWRAQYPFQSAMYQPRVIVRDSTRPFSG